MSSQTSEGLRERLFNALDLFIEKKISSKEVEGVCYISEQILKTASIELEFQREINSAKMAERRYLLEMKKEEKEAQKLLQDTLDMVVENEGTSQV